VQCPETNNSITIAIITRQQQQMDWHKLSMAVLLALSCTHPGFSNIKPSMVHWNDSDALPVLLLLSSRYCYKSSIMV
jgi:hypothetical protein